MQPPEQPERQPDPLRQEEIEILNRHLRKSAVLATSERKIEVLEKMKDKWEGDRGAMVDELTVKIRTVTKLITRCSQLKAAMVRTRSHYSASVFPEEANLAKHRRRRNMTIRRIKGQAAGEIARRRGEEALTRLIRTPHATSTETH